MTKKVISALTISTFLLMSGVALAQTTSTSSSSGTTQTTSSTQSTPGTTDSSGSSSTPGVPNTGAGGDATMNLLLLGASGLVALAGMVYLGRKAAIQ